MKPIYLMISEMFPTEENFRGPFVYDLAKAIQRSGRYRVVVAKPVNIRMETSTYEYDGIEVFRFHKTIPSSGFFSRFLWPSTAFFLIDKLREVEISIDEIDVCHLHGVAFCKIAKFIQNKNKKIKTVLHHHNLDIFGLDSSRLARWPFLRTSIQRNVIHLSNSIDIHLMVSRLTARQFYNDSKFQLKNDCILYNGVDGRKFYPLNLDKKDDRFYIGCVGNFIPLKDQMTLIRAAERLIDGGMRDLCVRFIGSGPTLATCQGYVGERPALRDRIEFLKEIDHRKLNEFYNSLDLFVLPSVYEAFGCVYTEAHACGVPFMACHGQGIEEMIPEGDQEKWLIKPHDFESLAQKIREFRENQPKQILNQPIDIDWHVGRYLDFLEGLSR